MLLGWQRRSCGSDRAGVKEFCTGGDVKEYVDDFTVKPSEIVGIILSVSKIRLMDYKVKTAGY